MLLPDVTKGLLHGYKQSHEDGELTVQTQFAMVRPDQAFDNMQEAAYMKVKLEKGTLDGRTRDVKELRNLDNPIYEFKASWEAENTKEPD